MSRQASAKCEITDSMVEAGVQVYQGYCPDSASYGVTDYEMVREILQIASRVSAGESLPKHPGLL